MKKITLLTLTVVIFMAVKAQFNGVVTIEDFKLITSPFDYCVFKEIPVTVIINTDGDSPKGVEVRFKDGLKDVIFKNEELLLIGNSGDTINLYVGGLVKLINKTK